MRVALLHYHLQPGGVTRVIQHAATALSRQGHDVLTLAGEQAPNGTPLAGAVHIEPGLAYSTDAAPDSGLELADKLERHASARWGAPPDVWHVHNHALGKNLAVTEAVYELAGRGHRLLLQPHDFAEDGRPGNYRHLLAGVGGGDGLLLTNRAYPQAPHVHYAVLNRRDAGFLLGAGVREDRLHVVPNPVAVDAPAEAGAPPETGVRLFVYPTRAIRRKNIGEFLLWAALGEEGDRFAITLAPTNLAARPVYERWVEVAQQHGLPVAFEAGRDRSFADVVGAAHALVTTSVAEGFGLAYLEPWLAGKPLVGRDLPEVTEEFAESGVDLSGLYRHLSVPVQWVGADELRETIRTALASYLDAYGRKMTRAAEDAALSATIVNQRVDVGRLNEAMQEEVLQKLVKDPALRAEIEPSTLVCGNELTQRVAHNRRAIEQGYSLEQYGTQLLRIYAQLMEERPESLQVLKGGAVLEQFLDPSRFYLLRT